MASPKLAPAARILLGAACVAMAGLFALRYYQAQETRQLAQEALALKQTIEPLTEPRIDSPDLSDYEALLRAEIFGEIPKEEVQRPQLSGILGEYAILNGRAVRQGQDIDGWKVDRIDVNEVRVTMGDRSE